MTNATDLAFMRTHARQSIEAGLADCPGWGVDELHDFVEGRLYEHDYLPFRLWYRALPVVQRSDMIDAICREYV